MSSTDSDANSASQIADSSSTGGRSVLPTFFLSHGGGPSYFMTVPPSSPFHGISAESINAQWLRDFTKTYRLTGEAAPKAIVVVSAHWETSGQHIRVTSRERHTKLNYDYGGFPPHTYKLEYSPPGNPALAQHIVDLLKVAKIQASVDTEWQFDHGVFVPLKMIFPEATIPVVEVSIDSSWDPAFHLAVGRALASLKREGILLIASGSSTHNFNPDARSNQQFMRGLEEIVTSTKLTTEERAQKSVLEWTKIPSARRAHPAEDHFVPFFVAVGAAEDQKAKIVGKVEPAGDWHLASVMFD